jgi:NADPH:quinone reductase-like Zn-dependent oxidoreductase
MGSGNASFTLGKMLYKRARLIGTVLRARPLEEKAALSQQFGREMLPLFDQGLLKPVIDRRFSIDEVVEAHRYMESNANVGKIVLDVG